ncbi:MAG TPA: T9SS type A sorting domain-containing protein [Bacteroidales bacterium]|nr:T9SS type A sorting domain-containing protein [Bacteroidales bacterium]
MARIRPGRVSGIFLILLLQTVTILRAQYAPPAGQPGSTAIYKDSSAIIGWASTCTINRGFIDMADTNLHYNGSNKATYGSYLYGSGPADELVVSLGDQGSAILGFDIPIENRPGPDFAVFENSFGDGFLELAFVEVSTDGQRFVRFPAVSLTQTDHQVNTFDTLKATQIHNLAGKYRHGYGTPFDLADLADSTGIDPGHIAYVRIIDVGGCLQAPFAQYDSQGHKINDPWPTPFDTGGFDLDAVGVIHDTTKAGGDPGDGSVILITPVPVTDKMNVRCVLHEPIHIHLSTLSGQTILDDTFTWKTSYPLGGLAAGLYLVSFTLPDGTRINKKIIKI